MLNKILLSLVLLCGLSTGCSAHQYSLYMGDGMFYHYQQHQQRYIPYYPNQYYYSRPIIVYPVPVYGYPQPYYNYYSYPYYQSYVK